MTDLLIAISLWCSPTQPGKESWPARNLVETQQCRERMMTCVDIKATAVIIPTDKMLECFKKEKL